MCWHQQPEGPGPPQQAHRHHSIMNRTQCQSPGLTKPLDVGRAGPGPMLEKSLQRPLFHSPWDEPGHTVHHLTSHSAGPGLLSGSERCGDC